MLIIFVNKNVNIFFYKIFFYVLYLFSLFLIINHLKTVKMSTTEKAKPGTTAPAASNGGYESVDVSRVEFFKFDSGNNKIFEGRFIKEKKISVGNTAFLFEKANGQRFHLPTHEEIARAIEDCGTGYYLIEFKNVENIENGKTLFHYDIKFKKK